MGAAAKQGRVAGELGAHTARAWAEQLLLALGQRALRPLELPDEHPALTWAQSGLMALTGRRDGPPQMCPAPLAACADGALAALASLVPEGAFAGLRGSQLLAERAAIAGHTRNGAISPGGSCRLLDTVDGRIALNLARDEDWSLLPAWLESDGVASWEAIGRAVRERPTAERVERGREIGLAVAFDEMPPGRPEWSSIVGAAHGRDSSGPAVAPMGRSHRNASPLVVDLSSLWAGPLCGHLLRLAGAEVIKVEGTRRPDGARQGPRAFFDLLNGGKASVALDFPAAEGREALRRLLRRADIVVESSRPRALRQLGIHAEQLLRSNPRLTWISITGHGRGPERGNWIAYGDDAGVAAGLSAVMREATGQRLIVGDAIADPLTGLHAALAAWAGYRSGGAGLISLALSDVVSHCIGFDPPEAGWAVRTGQWTRLLAQAGAAALAPRLRRPHGLARPLGASTGILGKTQCAKHHPGGAR